MLFVLISSNLRSQPSVEVAWEQISDTSIVNLGPCRLGDTLSARFLINNTGDKDLRITERIPSIYVGLSPNDTIDGNQFQEFREIIPSPRFDIPAGEKTVLSINYIPFNDTIAFPLGWKEAVFRLKIALVEDEDEIIYNHEYFLHAKKTKLLVDGYANHFSFDSVYVNPVIAKSQQWKIKNLIDRNILLDKQKDSLISQQLTLSEFEFSSLPENIMIQPGKIVDWDISYSPLDMGPDTSLFYIDYFPDKDQFPDSTDRIWCYFYGYGVKQDIRIIDCNFNVEGDTIDIGNIQLGESKTINCKVKNFGNIPFGMLSQRISDESSDLASGFEILSEFGGNNHLLPDSTGNFSIECLPEKSGKFIVKYEIESDIVNRDIYGLQADAEKLVFYIKGIGLEAKININSDSVDFGNVFSFLPYCESSRDTTITIKNNGNAELEIESIIIKNQEPDEAFYLEENSMLIPAYSSEKLKITFAPFINDEYSAELLLVTNLFPPNDSIWIYLEAVSVRPVRTILSMDSISAAPGRVVQYALKIDKNNVIHAKTFVDTIYFESTLLEYAGHETIGTASDGGLEEKIIAEFDPGKLSVFLSKPVGRRFLPSDTLLILKFRTYLGETIATKLSFTEPTFGDENCSHVLNILPTDGFFRLDSVCGLEYKATETNSNGHSLTRISPNPASDIIAVDFTAGFKGRVIIILYDNYGRKSLEVIDKIVDQGDYAATSDISNLPQGMYYIEMKIGLFRKILPVIITR